MKKSLRNARKSGEIMFIRWQTVSQERYQQESGGKATSPWFLAWFTLRP
jgi:hypothetical protein